MVSNSLGKLRELQETFRDLANGRPLRSASERKAVKVAVELGRTAIPLLGRKLRSPDDGEASWAYHLLVAIGGERAARAAEELALESGASDHKKALALALLSELGAPAPSSLVLDDPEALRESSVNDLLDTLHGEADVARAADLLLEQVEGQDLASFLEDMTDIGGGRVAPLIDELLLRDDLPIDSPAPLAALRAGLDPPKIIPPERAPRQTILVGERGDGVRVVLAAQRERVVKPPRLRAFVAWIEKDGRLGLFRYEPALVPRTGERRLIEALVESGFVMAAVSRAEGARLVADAAIKSQGAGERLPRHYWLARDLLGLYDAHRRRPRRSGDGRERLARAIDCLDRKDAAGARDVLAKYVDDYPDDAEGRSLYGTCVLEDGDLEAACGHYAAAARLEPEEALHHWNLAHASKRAERLGGCYLALMQYLERGDEEPGAKKRTTAARQYVRLFEKYARIEHPDVDVVRVARAEELFERAFRHLRDGRLVDAVSGFEAVVKIVPSHYPSWGNLGVAFAAMHDRERAERCWRKALEYRPDYDVAVKNLGSIAD